MILPRNNVLVTFSRKDLRSNIRLATHCTPPPPRISFPQAALQLYFSIDWSRGGECEKFHKNLSIEVTWLRTFFHSVSIIDWNISFSLSRIPCSSVVKNPNSIRENLALTNKFSILVNQCTYELRSFLLFFLGVSWLVDGLSSPSALSSMSSIKSSRSSSSSSLDSIRFFPEEGLSASLLSPFSSSSTLSSLSLLSLFSASDLSLRSSSLLLKKKVRIGKFCWFRFHLVLSYFMTYLAFFQAFLTFTNVSRSHKTELRLFIHAMYWLYFLNVPFWQHFQWNTYNSIDRGACSSVDLVHQLITETMLTDIVTNHTNMCISKQTKSR